MLRTKELLGTLYGYLFYLIHELAAAVIPLTRKTLSILVGHHVRHGFGDRSAHIVLRSNKLDTRKLTHLFALDNVGNLWVGSFEMLHAHRIFGLGTRPFHGIGR